MSQPELAELTKLSTASISNYELGKRQPAVDELVAIARALRTTVAYLIGETDVVDPNQSRAPTQIQEFRTRNLGNASVEDREQLMRELERIKHERNLIAHEREIERRLSELGRSS